MEYSSSVFVKVLIKLDYLVARDKVFFNLNISLQNLKLVRARSPTNRASRFTFGPSPLKALPINKIT